MIFHVRWYHDVWYVCCCWRTKEVHSKFKYKVCSCGRFYHYKIPRDHVIAFLDTRNCMKHISVLSFIAWRISEVHMSSLLNLSPARVCEIYPIIFQSLNWWHPIQVDQLENRMLNVGRSLLMWNSKGQRLLVVDGFKLDITGRHVQIILLKNNFMIFTFCYTTCFVLWNKIGIINFE